MRVSLHQNGHISPDTTESEREREGGGEAIVGSVCGFKRPRPGLPLSAVAFSPVSNGGGGRLPRWIPPSHPGEEGNKICNRGENVMKFASMKRWKLARSGRPFSEQVVRARGWLLHQI